MIGLETTSLLLSEISALIDQKNKYQDALMEIIYLQDEKASKIAYKAMYADDNL